MTDNRTTIAVVGDDPFARLPALAARLGVAERAPDAPPSVIVSTRDGKQYDLFELITAFLDRLDDGGADA